MPHSTTARLLTVLPLVAGLVGVVLYGESKAGNGRVDAIEARMNATEIARATQAADLAWIKSTLWALSRAQGVVVPPPPNP
jgi:hypothetical protein